ncbi:MAG: DNA-3-methyladenine glycosylase [Actinobacteria bacterium]|nr:DNA-3-methyladenine glycosylase [Actinomycetota bacterium]MBU4489957.1 DNA-3-methyladenine glycosylase [Actinomycetota bacterium]MCG2796311.1 DNA-3-methyladenine glycosylase [Actinomycetes bacterium]
MRLPRSFYSRRTLEVARGLLGCILVHRAPTGTAAGMIVESEGYLGPGDGASHARFGPTPRSEIMFGAPGAAYVYFIYGMHYMFNAVTAPPGTAGAVLVRALEPMYGLDVMEARRGMNDRRLLTSGPARLCQALAITVEQNGADLCSGPLGIEKNISFGDGEVEATPRIGVAELAGEPYRFLVKGNRYVSR